MNKIIMFLFYCLLAVPVHAQTAKVYNFKLVHNFDDNGRKMLKMCFHCAVGQRGIPYIL